LHLEEKILDNQSLQVVKHLEEMEDLVILELMRLQLRGLSLFMVKNVHKVFSQELFDRRLSHLRHLFPSLG
jgi:hypothetical protein